jgi:DNA-binding CsgD family transcriptional regulator
MEILRLVATGATNQQIAHDLFISVNTVKVHLRNIFSKLGVESRTEATTFAIRAGWVVMSGPQPPARGSDDLTMAKPRIATWQRVLLLASAVMIAALVLSPPTRRIAGNGGQLTDQSAGGTTGSLGAASSRWLNKAQMPTARSRLAVAAVDGLVYAVGGDTADGVTGIVEVYDPAADTWARKASKPRAVRNISAAVLEGKVYVPGGYDATDQAISVVEVYDPSSDTWSEASPLPEALCAYGLTVWRGKLYLFGGSDGIRYLDHVWIYDPDADTWNPGTALSQPRGFSAAAAVGESIFLVGGYDGQVELALCEEYRPTTEGSGESPWTARKSMTFPRGGLVAVPAEGYVYAMGGGWTTYLTGNERYDIANDTWTTFDSPLLGQWRTFGAAAVGSKEGTVVHTIGGWSDRHLSANLVYQVFYRIYLPGL